MLALIADFHRDPTRSLATGLHMSGLYVGTTLGGVGLNALFRGPRSTTAFLVARYALDPRQYAKVASRIVIQLQREIRLTPELIKGETFR